MCPREGRPGSTRRPVRGRRLVFEGEADLDHDLIVHDAAALDVTARLDHLKPASPHPIRSLAPQLRAFDPEYLRDRMQATGSVIEKLQERTTRPLFACKLRAKPELKVVAGGRG